MPDYLLCPHCMLPEVYHEEPCMNRLTEHFALEELIHSNTAVRLGIPNDPNPWALSNLQRLALFLEEVRKVLGCPILISSGFRSQELNKAVGGAANSQHLMGLAADFIAPSYGSPFNVCTALAAFKLPFDQLIHEFGAWTHISIPPNGTDQRGMLLTIDKSGTHEGIQVV